MALPKIDLPLYETKLISNGKKVKYRPFTVKEEKLFLMAKETEDLETTFGAIKQVLTNCVQTDMDIEKLPVFDIEHLFLKIRSVSVGEIVKLQYTCNNHLPLEEGQTEQKTCGNIVELDFDLNTVDVVNAVKEPKIQITDKMGIVMKYPTFDILKTISDDDEVTDAIMDMTIGCIDYIYDDESIYYTKDYAKEELIDFIESLQTKDLEKIRDFFNMMPKLKKNVMFKCGKCGYEEEIEVEGLQNFFG